jgi:hypothetical protein
MKESGMEKQYTTFLDFYPFYLSEHGNRTNRRLHFIGSCLVLIVLFYSLFTSNWIKLFWMPVFGYGFAWAGHLFFEKNRPATFIYPVFSLMGDWVMFKDILTGKIKF